MKTFLFILSFFSFQQLYCQDSLKIKQIDSLVGIISNSKLPTQRDSILKDYPLLGLNMKTYITIVTFGKEAKKYSQIARATQKEGKITKEDISGSAFYYDQNKLIKVEEFFIRDGKENKAEWYFSDDQCFFHSLTSGNAGDRVSVLLQLSNGILKKITAPN